MQFSMKQTFACRKIIGKWRIGQQIGFKLGKVTTRARTVLRVLCSMNRALRVVLPLGKGVRSLCPYPGKSTTHVMHVDLTERVLP